MKLEIKKSIDALREYRREADQYFLNECYEYGKHGNGDGANLKAAEYYIERSFVELLLLLDNLDLQETYSDVESLFKEAKGNLTHSSIAFDDPYLVWGEKIAMYTEALANIHNIESREKVVIKDLKEILRAAVYQITDESIFGSVPNNEADVHKRLEAILKCHYRDLKTKPSISKRIKNFEPDTGIQSIKTLIEYKFIKSKSQAKIVVDEILADTRGYTSIEWHSFLYVIYETGRVMSEKDWKDLFEECGIAENSDVLVLSGVACKA
ncbi:hypothetical protein V8073_004852 [Vibrio parahaemolyticus]